MKKLGLLFLVFVVALGVSGCSKDNDADPVGTWSFLLDEACDGADLALVVHIFSNGTFVVDGGMGGTWTVSDDDITLNISGGGLTLILSGSVDGSGMTGTFVGAGSGCWTGTRTSTTP